MNPTSDVQTVIERFTAHDIRLTPQRISVYKYVIDHPDHPTVDMVYSDLKSMNPSLSKTTIYNIAEVLEGAGLIKILRIGDGDVRLDACIDQPAHFHCKKCGKILNLQIDSISIPAMLNGYQIDEYDIYASGICPDCLD